MSDVLHQPFEQRFIIEQDGARCVLDYRVSDDVVNFTHTYVPPELRGKGLAEKLVRTGLKWAQDEGLKKEASCWYVAKFIQGYR